jgi:hypothetical protein
MAPRVEVYTNLVCKVIRPDYPDATHIRYRYAAHRVSFSGSVRMMFVVDSSGKEPSRNSCATDPVVQAGVSKLIAGGWCSVQFARRLA